MKYTCKVVINLPREKVIELFDNPDNMFKWQPDLVSFEHIEGTPGEPGAKSKLTYDMKGRETVLIETLTLKDLPERFEGTYDTKGIHNVIKNRFLDNDDGTTTWETTSEFQMQGFFMKLMGFIAPGMFKKQSALIQKRFKEFAENTGSDGKI